MNHPGDFALSGFSKEPSGPRGDDRPVGARDSNKLGLRANGDFVGSYKERSADQPQCDRAHLVPAYRIGPNAEEIRTDGRICHTRYAGRLTNEQLVHKLIALRRWNKSTRQELLRRLEAGGARALLVEYHREV